MPEFTPGNWWIAPPMFDGDVIHAPPTVESRRNDVVAMGILNHVDAQLIANALEMYRLLEGFCKIYSVKVQAKADNDKVKFVGALLAEEDTEASARLIVAVPEMYEILQSVAFGCCDDCFSRMVAARELLSRIDGKENGHD